MIIDIDTASRTIFVWSGVRIYNDAKFESLHPRDKDGKFSSGVTGGNKSTGINNPNYRSHVPADKIAMHVDFDKIPHDISKKLESAISENIKNYPFMADHFSFIGSDCAPMAKDMGRYIDPNDNTVATYTPEKNGGRGQLCFSSEALKRNKIKSDILDKIRQNDPSPAPKPDTFRPNGTDTPKGIADHEFGHALWYKLGLNRGNNKPLHKFIRNYIKSHSKEYVEKELSRYAATDEAEFFAEAFAELQNNPQPRPLAIKIGELLDEEIKSQKLDTNK